MVLLIQIHRDRKMYHNYYSSYREQSWISIRTMSTKIIIPYFNHQKCVNFGQVKVVLPYIKSGRLVGIICAAESDGN